MTVPASPYDDSDMTDEKKQERFSGSTLRNSDHAELATTKGFDEKDARSRFEQVLDDEAEDVEIKYRTMQWYKVAALMLAETVSIGILSIPSAFATVGMPAGILLVIGLGAIATYTGWVIGMFKMRYPSAMNMADAGEILAGRFGRELLGAGQIIFTLFVCASHVLTGLIALDTISNNALCVIVWAVLIAAISAVLSVPRTFNGVAPLTIVSFASIVGSIFITMIAVGVTGHRGEVTTTSSVPFSEGFLAVTNIIFAYAGHVVFLQFISEMRTPSDYPKTIVALQGSATLLYVIVGIVIYAYVGDTASSPALGNTGQTVQRVAYGIALPTIIIAGVINANVACKLIMHRLFVRAGHKPSRHTTENTWYGWTVWLAIVATFWTLAFIIAEVIPFFNDLLGVISSLFAAWFTYGLSGIFWLFITPRDRWFSSARMKAMVGVNVAIIAMGAFIMVGGLYASITGIMEGYAEGGFGGPFSCTPPADS